MKVVLPCLLLSLVAVVGISYYTTGALPLGESRPKDVRLTGVLASNKVVVASKLGGRLTSLTVDEGSRVRLGDEIGRLDSVELESQRDGVLAHIAQLEARVAQSRVMVALERDRGIGTEQRAVAAARVARSQAAQAQAELEQQRSDEVRLRNLASEALVPRQEVERVATEVRVGESRLKALQDQIAVAEAELALARANRRQVTLATGDVDQVVAELERARSQLAEIEARLTDASIKAPISGLVSLRVARQGEIVRAGDPIVTIVDLDDVWVKAEIEESSVSRFVVGSKFVVELASGERTTGVVTFIAPEADFATQRDVDRVKRDVRTFGIKVAVPNPERRLHPGMTAYVLVPPEGGGRPTANVRSGRP